MRDAAQLLLGKPPRSVKDLPPLFEKPKPVAWSLFMGEQAGDMNVVESFQASTTYCPEPAMEVSDCPSARVPDNQIISLGLTAFTFQPNDALFAPTLCPPHPDP